MIKTFSARNFRCLKKVTAELAPLHAFIGPNDSGKSTLLDGLRTLVQLAGGTFPRGKAGTLDPFEPDLPERPAVPEVELACAVEGGSYSFSRRNPSLMETATLPDGQVFEGARESDRPNMFARRTRTRLASIMDQLRTVRLVRFDPDALRAPSGLIPDAQREGFLDERGHGLPGLFFALRNQSDEAFAAVVEGTRKHFPTIKTLRLKPVTSGTLVLEAELADGVRVEARRLSEGLLYYLAFAALRHLEPASLLLVEEPENGLHPARIADVVRMLRALVDETGTQVVMATHSPLVINELKPEEVTVVTRPSLEEGTRLTPIAETHNFRKRSSVYALGELWLSFADGIDEVELLQGRGA